MLDTNISKYINSEESVEEVGSGGGSIDADTLNDLLTGSNGISIAKAASGEMVEIKLADTVTFTSSTYRQTVINGDGVYFKATPGAPEQPYLHQGNVKTLFGNQSIYGSGNIDLYRHTIIMSTLYAEVNKVEMDITFEVISSKSTVIDSLTDLFNVLNGITVPVGGLCSPDGTKDYNAQLISIANASSSYIQYFNSSGTGSYGRAFLYNADSSLTITDTVTTV